MRRASYLEIGLAGGLLAFAVVCTTSYPANTKLDDAPLSQHPDNPHYLMYKNKPTILVGSTEHYGAVLNLDFDYVKYLDELHTRGLNLTRTFSGSYHELPSSFGIVDNTLAPKPDRFIGPWPPSETASAGDGLNKYGLKKWNEAYFARLKDFVREASTRRDCRRGRLVLHDLRRQAVEHPSIQSGEQRAADRPEIAAGCLRSQGPAAHGDPGAIGREDCQRVAGLAEHLLRNLQ